MEKEKNKIKGVLLDSEGTLINVNQWLPGGKETLDWLLTHSRIKEDFPDIKLNENIPDVVLIGDMGDEWNIQSLNQECFMQHIFDAL